MKNWQKILKNYLTGPLIGGLSRSGVDPGCAAFLLLRAVVTEKKPLVVVFPELNPAERTAAECEALALLAGIRVRVLSIPECAALLSCLSPPPGRLPATPGKRLFPEISPCFLPHFPPAAFFLFLSLFFVELKGRFMLFFMVFLSV